MSRESYTEERVAGLLLPLRKYGGRVANPFLARQPEYRERLERSLSEGCLFCPGGQASFAGQEPFLRRDEWVVYQNDHPAKGSLYLNDQGWDRDYFAGSFFKHLLVFDRGTHREGLEQLSADEFGRWWELIALGIELRPAKGVRECPFVYIKEGDPDANSATVDHLHAQLISLDANSLQEVVRPLVGCCLDGALLQPLADVLNAGDLTVKTGAVHCVSLHEGKTADTAQRLGHWKVSQVFGTESTWKARWRFIQMPPQPPACRYGDFAEEDRLKDFRELLLSITTEHAGGVLVVYHKDNDPALPLEAQYFVLRKEIAAVVTT